MEIDGCTGKPPIIFIAPKFEAQRASLRARSPLNYASNLPQRIMGVLIKIIREQITVYLMRRRNMRTDRSCQQRFVIHEISSSLSSNQNLCLELQRSKGVLYFLLIDGIDNNNDVRLDTGQGLWRHNFVTGSR